MNMRYLVRWQTFFAVMGILVVGGLLVQLSFTRQAVIVPVRGGIYTEGMVGSPQYLNPLLATTDVDRVISSLLFDGLSTLQSDGSVVPALAEEWEVAASGTIYTCTLRSGARWHDGTPVTSADVLFTLNLIRSPEIPDPNLLKELWSQVQAEALGEQRVRFTLERPYAPFLSYTTLQILPAHLLAGISPAELELSPFNLNPVGTGPFRFVEISETEDGILMMGLEANPFYYRQPFYLEGARLLFYRDRSTLEEALLGGDVDGAFGLSAEALSRVAEDPALVSYRTYLQACTILFLNVRSTLLSDLRLRQAIAMGLDRNALLDGYAERVFAANGPISPISWAYKPDLVSLPYDPAAAAALLEEAGWEDRNNDGIRDRDVRSLELTLLTQDIPAERVGIPWLTLARRIEQQLAPLGIAVRVVVLTDPQEFRARFTERDFDLLLYGWGQLGRDPDGFALWHSSQAGAEGLNLSSLQDPEIDALLESGRTVRARDVRTQLYWQFQERFVEQVPAIPLYYPVYTYVLNTRIRGVQVGPLNDLGDRFQNVTGWYIKTQKVILDRSRPASRSGDSR
jgi:peptide/nickel transport system substrate-binding protein